MIKILGLALNLRIETGIAIQIIQAKQVKTVGQAMRLQQTLKMVHNKTRKN